MPDLPTSRDDPHAARVRALDLFRGGALIIALVILLALLWTIRAFVLDSPTKALYVLIAYVIIQQIESNIVSPLVMKRGVDVPPVVTILAGTVMTILFGFPGLLVAVPLAAALLTVAREVTAPVPEEQIGSA